MKNIKIQCSIQVYIILWYSFKDQLAVWHVSNIIDLWYEILFMFNHGNSYYLVKTIVLSTARDCDCVVLVK